MNVNPKSDWTSDEVVHKRPQVVFRESGFSIQPWFFRNVDFSWDEVRFISPTPIYERAEDGSWSPSPSPDYLLTRGRDPARSLVDSGDIELRIAVHKNDLPWWMTVAPGSVYVSPMYDASDQPHRSVRVVTLELNKHRLSTPVSDLFDLLSRCARFDLLVTDG